MQRSSIGFVPAGASGKPVLPDESFWLSTLWSNVYNKGTDPCSKGINTLVDEDNSWKSMSDMRDDFEEYRKSEIWEQPICKDAKSFKTKLAIGFGVGGAAAGAGLAGAGVGGTIGALAIGIPSFGVAAGAGLAIGAVVGGGIGVGIVGAATASTKAYKKYNNEVEQQKSMYT